MVPPSAWAVLIILLPIALATNVYFNATTGGTSGTLWSSPRVGVSSLAANGDQIFSASCTALTAMDSLHGSVIWTSPNLPTGPQVCIASVAAVMNHSVIVSLNSTPVVFVAVNRSNGAVVTNFTVDGFASADCQDPLFGERLLPPPEGFPSAGDFAILFCGSDFALVSIDDSDWKVQRRGIRLCDSPAWDNMGYQVCAVVRSEEVVPTVSLKYSAIAIAESVWPNHPKFWSFTVRSVVVDITVVTSPFAVAFMASRGLHTVVVLQNVSSGVYSSYGVTIGLGADWSRTLLPTRAGSVLVRNKTSVSRDTACIVFATGAATSNVQCVTMPSGAVLSVHEVPVAAAEVVVAPSTAAQTVLLVAGSTAKLFTFSGNALWSVTLGQVTSTSLGAALEFTAVISLASALLSMPLCNTTTNLVQCALPNTASSSSSSSSGSGNVEASNLAATVGAGIGVLFLIGFNRYLEYKYPNARRSDNPQARPYKNAF